MKIVFILLANIYLYAQDMRGLLFNGNCTTCHFVDKSVSAPAMNIVKQRYKKAFPKREDFINYMSKWVENPNSQTSLMDDMIRKYEIMPLLGFERSTLLQITSYIYDANLSNNKR
jgi:cytochrome c551/c552